MTRLKVRISQNIASFAHNSPKQALRYIIFFKIKKRQKNGQIILFLANRFKKSQMATMPGLDE